MTDFKPSNQIALYDQSGNAAVITSGVGQHVIITSGFSSIFTSRGLNFPLITTFVLTSSGSGGVALASNTSSYSFGITVKNAGNTVGISGVILLGTSGSPPFISGGYPLAVGESIQLDVTRPDLVRAYGTLSGTSVGWIGRLG